MRLRFAVDGDIFPVHLRIPSDVAGGCQLDESVCKAPHAFVSNRQGLDISPFTGNVCTVWKKIKIVAREAAVEFFRGMGILAGEASTVQLVNCHNLHLGLQTLKGTKMRSPGCDLGDKQNNGNPDHFHSPSICSLPRTDSRARAPAPHRLVVVLQPQMCYQLLALQMP